MKQTTRKLLAGLLSIVLLCAAATGCSSSPASSEASEPSVSHASEAETSSAGSVSPGGREDVSSGETGENGSSSGESSGQTVSSESASLTESPNESSAKAPSAESSRPATTSSGTPGAPSSKPTGGSSSVSSSGSGQSSSSESASSTPANRPPTVSTTLKDGQTYTGSTVAFELRAREPDGKKLDASKVTVQLNGKTVPATWDDSSKTTYTLTLKEGTNTVKITASGREGARVVQYTLKYTPAASGGVIGYATISVEAFAVGCGYLVEPTIVPLYEGENGADLLTRVLSSAGYGYRNTGTVKQGFYLSAIMSGSKKLNLSPNIPAYLVPYLESEMDWFDPEDYDPDRLGEFDFCNGSGWMVSVNNTFPNVGFSDIYPGDGDVIRVQYTLSYGKDNGGYGSVGSGENASFFPIADKDALTARIAEVIKSGKQSSYGARYQTALSVVSQLNAAQAAVDSALRGIS